MIKSVRTVALALAGLAIPAGAQTTDDLLAASRAVSAQLVQQLGAQLKQELARGGPEGAIAVCSEAAPAIAGQLSRQSGARVARVSLRTRNPLLGTPDAWEQAVLADFDRRAAAGEKPESLEYSASVSRAAGALLPLHEGDPGSARVPGLPRDRRHDCTPGGATPAAGVSARSGDRLHGGADPRRRHRQAAARLADRLRSAAAVRRTRAWGYGNSMLNATLS